MAYEQIGDQVAVQALFEKGGLRPLAFLWEGRRYPVEQVRFRWQTREGRATLHFFALVAGGQACELSFHSEALTWKLEKIWE
jgi:hypothetical protein